MFLNFEALAFYIREDMMVTQDTSHVPVNCVPLSDMYIAFGDLRIVVS